MSNVLSPADILDLTGQEPPLTPEDMRTAVQFAFHGWRGEFLLAGRPDARTGDWGCAGWLGDHYSVNITSSSRGLLIRATEHADSRTSLVRPRPAPAAVRVGRITWRTAEAILRSASEPRPGEQASLFALEAL
jgi:hypothetical protein